MKLNSQHGMRLRDLERGLRKIPYRNPHRSKYGRWLRKQLNRCLRQEGRRIIQDAEQLLEEARCDEEYVDAIFDLENDYEHWRREWERDRFNYETDHSYEDWHLEDPIGEDYDYSEDYQPESFDAY